MDIYKKNSIEELLCYCALIMLFAIKGMGDISKSIPLKLILFVACLLLVTKLLVMNWTWRELVCTIYINLLGIIVWIFSGEYSIFITILVITSLKDINIKTALKICFWSAIIFFMIHMLLILIGIFDGELSYSLDDGIRKRYGLGYGHANSAHSFVTTIIFLGILAYKDRLKISHYMLLGVFNLMIYQFTDSRTGMLLSLFGICSTYILYLVNKFNLIKYIDIIIQNKFVKFFISNTFIIITILAFIMCWLYAKYGMFGKLGTLSSRFFNASRVIENNKITLFGQRNIDTDLGYVYILYKYGGVFWSSWLIAYSLLLRKIIENKLYIECMIVICFAIYSIIECFTGSILANITLIFISFLIYPNNLKMYKNKLSKDK